LGIAKRGNWPTWQTRIDTGKSLSPQRPAETPPPAPCEHGNADQPRNRYGPDKFQWHVIVNAQQKRREHEEQDRPNGPKCTHQTLGHDPRKGCEDWEP
jgi:hypothetical protein